jgi:hypothetical protein
VVLRSEAATTIINAKGGPSSPNASRLAKEAPMNDRHTKRRWARAGVGLGLALIGSAGLIGLQILVYAHNDAAERLQIAMGLGGATLASAVALVVLLAGAALIWSAIREDRGQRTR